MNDRFVRHPRSHPQTAPGPAHPIAFEAIETNFSSKVSFGSLRRDRRIEEKRERQKKRRKIRFYIDEDSRAMAVSRGFACKRETARGGTSEGAAAAAAATAAAASTTTTTATVPASCYRCRKDGARRHGATEGHVGWMDGGTRRRGKQREKASRLAGWHGLDFSLQRPSNRFRSKARRARFRGCLPAARTTRVVVTFPQNTSTEKRFLASRKKSWKIDRFVLLHLYVSDSDRYSIESDRVILSSKRSIRLPTRWLVYIYIASNDLEPRNVTRVPESI